MVSKITSYFKDSYLYKKFQAGSRMARQAFYDVIPNKVIENEKIRNGITWVNKEISTPENRLILGATALMSQPFIDWHNKSVDENTRKVSVCRTVAKIVAGTFTGYFIRKGCIKAIDKWSKLPTSVDKSGNKIKLTRLNTLFSPSNAMSDLSDAFMQYNNALGTIVALGVMTITNFLIDAPLTKYLTNKFVVASGGLKHDKSK